MTASLLVAKKKPVGPKPLMYPAIPSYKEWVWKRLKSDGWVLQDLVDEMKRLDRTQTKLTTSTLSQLLGHEDGPWFPSSSTLIPLVNRALRIEPPPVCNPADPLARIRDHFTDRWNKLTPNMQRALLEILGGDSSNDPSHSGPH